MTGTKPNESKGVKNKEAHPHDAKSPNNSHGEKSEKTQPGRNLHQTPGDNHFEKGTHSWREDVQKARDKQSIENYASLDNDVEFKGVSRYSIRKSEPDSPTLFSDVDDQAFVYQDLETFARERGYKTTDSIGEGHGEFSFHTDGRAIDVSTKGPDGKQLPRSEIEAMKADFRRHGLYVYDETLPENRTSNTTGPHLHVDNRTPAEHRERSSARRYNEKIDYEGAYGPRATRVDLGLTKEWPPRRRK